jgi:hypothetical protein
VVRIGTEADPAIRMNLYRNEILPVHVSPSTRAGCRHFVSTVKRTFKFVNCGDRVVKTKVG